jgi:hypothetical protein
LSRQVLRTCCVVAFLLTAFLTASPSQAQGGQECPKCYEECDWWPGFMTICFEAPQGTVGYCRCYERPCRNDGYFCSVVWVTP